VQGVCPMIKTIANNARDMRAFALKRDVVMVALLDKDREDDVTILHSMSPAEAKRVARELDCAADVATGGNRSSVPADELLYSSPGESEPLHLVPETVDLLIEACQEIEQLARVIGTLPADGSGIDLMLRGVAMRLDTLNSLISWALVHDGSFKPAEAFETIHGPRHWLTAMADVYKAASRVLDRARVCTATGEG